ncbi:hypothetical protein H206_05571 [Candidatus Electrothrix aarhusensis]|uniref:Uncharacterized protein n=1 Tax=Candidatus Electrothrix aarhusensis TaxID=1859131 RepID=A0A444J448_9BACT|nr:hypothetical protein H206_05571 [Candidatus Electrothrix aarhusensis]
MFRPVTGDGPSAPNHLHGSSARRCSSFAGEPFLPREGPLLRTPVEDDQVTGVRASSVGIAINLAQPLVAGGLPTIRGCTSLISTRLLRPPKRISRSILPRPAAYSRSTMPPPLTMRWRKAMSSKCGKASV